MQKLKIVKIVYDNDDKTYEIGQLGYRCDSLVLLGSSKIGH